MVLITYACIYVTCRTQHTYIPVVQAFKKRHPEVVIRVPERVSKARANVNEPAIRNWFATVQRELAELNALDVLEDPTRIFNCDETNIQLCPSTGKVIGIKGWKNVYELAPGPEKSTLTFVGTFSAGGNIVTPAIIFPYVRVPADIVKSIPSGFFIGNTESGWMKAECWYEYLANAFIPYVNEHNIQKPVILFVDGHSTHTTLQVSQLCEENGVILYLLTPNTTHILQPADVGPFRPLKVYWAQEVREFQRKNVNCVVRRQNVGPLLKNVLDKIKRSSIINGFSRTGIYPFDADKPDYSKCLETKTDDEPEGDVSNGNVNLNEEEKKVTQMVIKKLFGENQEEYRKFSVSELWSRISDSTHQEAPENVDNDPSTNNVEVNELPASAPITVVVDGKEFSINLVDQIPNEEFECETEIVCSGNEKQEVQTNVISIEETYNPVVVSKDSTKLEDTATRSPSVIIDETPGCSSKKSVLGDHIFWNGQITYKKHKNPKEQLPSLISSEKFRKILIEKEEKKTKNKKNDDWICVYCSGSFSADKRAKKHLTWIECDSCSSKMHLNCVPRDHLPRSGYESDDDDDDKKFICDQCM